MSDPYLDPKSGVLRNKLGLTDTAALEHAEALLTTLRDTEVASTTVPGVYDLAHLCRFHRRIFGDDDAGFGDSREYIVGANFYPFKTRNARVNAQIIDVDKSAVSSVFGFYVGGQTGTTYSVAASLIF